MEGIPEGVLGKFVAQLLRSPIRWVVAVHAMLLVGVIILNRAMLGSYVAWHLDASLVIAQVALLLIWMTLDETSSIRRFFGAALITSGILLAHTIPFGLFDPGMLCIVPAIFLLLNVASLPTLLVGQAGLVIRRFHLHNLPPARRLQFSIRSVLVASITLALLFGLGNLPHAFSKTGSPPGFGLAHLVLLFVMLGVFLSIPAVAVWTVLRPGTILPRMIIALFGSGLAGALVFHLNQQLGASPENLLPPALATASGLAILLATLLVLRAMGYRAVWLNEEAASHPDVSMGTSPFASASEKPTVP